MTLLKGQAAFTAIHIFTHTQRRIAVVKLSVSWHYDLKVAGSNLLTAGQHPHLVSLCDPRPRNDAGYGFNNKGSRR